MQEPGPPDDPDGWADLVVRAIGNDAAAWATLVDRLERVVWKAVNMMTSDTDVRDDAFAATWLRLAEKLHTIREPHKLPGWMATTAANEVRTLNRQRNRTGITLATVRPLGDAFDVFAEPPSEPGQDLLDAERAREVRAAFARLDPPCREVLAVLVVDDVPYGEASARLGRPVGALGPTRRRCLEKLRAILDEGTATDV